MMMSLSPHQKSVLSFPLSVNQFKYSEIIGTSHGLFCFHGRNRSRSNIAVIWNPSIQKSVNVFYKGRHGLNYFGLGVCPDTLDPKIVKISFNKEVEVFTLSSQIWRGTLCCNNNVPHESVQLKTPQVALGGLINFLAFDHDEYDTTVHSNSNSNLIVSFDLISEEFTEMCLPDSLSRHQDDNLSLTNLRGSLVVLQYNTYHNRGFCCAVWMVEPTVENSFRCLYTITVPHASADEVLGFRKDGTPIIVIRKYNESKFKDEVAIYDPDIELISKIGVDGEGNSVFGCCYVETLLLLGH